MSLSGRVLEGYLALRDRQMREALAIAGQVAQQQQARMQQERMEQDRVEAENLRQQREAQQRLQEADLALRRQMEERRAKEAEEDARRAAEVERRLSQQARSAEEKARASTFFDLYQRAQMPFDAAITMAGELHGLPFDEESRRRIAGTLVGMEMSRRFQDVSANPPEGEAVDLRQPAPPPPAPGAPIPPQMMPQRAIEPPAFAPVSIAEMMRLPAPSAIAAQQKAQEEAALRAARIENERQRIALDADREMRKAGLDADRLKLERDRLEWNRERFANRDRIWEKAVDANVKMAGVREAVMRGNLDVAKKRLTIAQQQMTTGQIAQLRGAANYFNSSVNSLQNEIGKIDAADQKLAVRESETRTYFLIQNQQAAAQGRPQPYDAAMIEAVLAPIVQQRQTLQAQRQDLLSQLQTTRQRRDVLSPLLSQEAMVIDRTPQIYVRPMPVGPPPPALAQQLRQSESRNRAAAQQQNQPPARPPQRARQQRAAPSTDLRNVPTAELWRRLRE